MDISLILGRCARTDQEKETRFYVLWVEGEKQDEAPRLMRNSRISEAEALTRLNSERIERGKKRKRGTSESGMDRDDSFVLSSDDDVDNESDRWEMY